MNTPSELREAFKKEAVDYAISYMQLVMRPSQESKELANKKLDEFLNKSLDAVIASLPDTKQPGTYNALLNPEIYGYIKAIKEVRQLLHSAKSISKESE